MSLSNILYDNNYSLKVNSLQQLHPEEFSVYPSTNQALSTSSTTKIAFDTALTTNPNFDLTNHQYTVPVTGKYKFVVSVAQTIVTSGASTATFSINLINLTPVRSGNWQSVLVSGQYVEMINFELIGNFAAGDIVYVQSQPPTPNTNITSYNVFALSTYFSGELL